MSVTPAVVRKTTKLIQGSTRPGHTCVDSTGLHSVIPENEARAKASKDVAGLTDYPMHTNSGGHTNHLLFAKYKGRLQPAMEDTNGVPAN